MVAATSPRRLRIRPRIVPVLATAALVAAMTFAASAPAQAATASGGPGSTPYWNESGGVQGFATSTSSSSKVWYTLGDGELENAFYPETDEPDTYGLQYYVTDGSSFADSEVSNTAHAVTLADPTSLTWQQTNTATNGDFSIVKTYIADPNASVILVQTTFTNKTSKPLGLYADYQPYLDNQGDGNTGGTDAASGDLEAVNGSVASALTASTGFTASSTGYVGTGSSGVSELTSGYSLGTAYSGVSSSGHLDQTAQIPVNASGSTSFTLALAFDTSESAAIADASGALGTGFSSLESGYEAGWHSWQSGLDAAPASVTGNAALLNQYYVSLMELKADEDKTYVGGFVASPTDPWGASDSAASAGNHGYHLVWTRDEYEMATALLASGDSADASAALSYILKYEIESSGEAKQNTWLNGNQEWSGQQMDESADPIILAYQLNDTGAPDWSVLKTEADYLMSNGPYTGQERWEENSGYSPSTIATEIAGLVCASVLAGDQGDSSDASTYLNTAKTWAGEVDGWTYTTDGPLGSGSYFIRDAVNGTPNDNNTISLANGGGSYDQRDIVDAGFLELVRLGIKAASSSDVTGSLAVVDSTIGVQTPQGLMFHRYNHDGYGETSSGADYTGAGVGNLWPVFNGERGEYDVANGDLTDAQSELATMQASASADGQIPEQVWSGSTASSEGWALGQPDNSATPLMWSMAQYVRLADDISAKSDLDTPPVVCQTFGTCTSTATNPPGTPTGLKATGETSTTVSLSWSASTGASGYAVLRNGTQVGTTSSTTYTDTGLSPSTTYSYTVEAFNSAGASAASGAVSATTAAAGSGGVTETFDVTVPVNTAASGDTVYLDGNLSVLGNGGTDWAAAGVAMTKVDDTHYTATVTATGAATLQYKYDLGGNWNNSEETASCGYVGNRSVPVDNGTQTDTVANWEGPNTCGNAQAVIDVTAPSSTPSTGTVYIAGDFSALGTGMSSANDWAAGLYPMTKTGADTWQILVPAVSGSTLQYKFDLDGTWTDVEEASGCGYVNNRSFTFNGADSSYTANDTVVDWAGLNGC